MLLKDKKILIMGIRNKWSIAYGIAKSAYDNGAKLIFTYMGEENKDKIIKEPTENDEESFEKIASNLKKEIKVTIEEMNKQTIEDIVQKRYEKFRNMGEFISL